MIKLNLKTAALVGAAALALATPLAASAQHIVVGVGIGAPRVYDPYYGGYVVYDAYGRWVDAWGNWHYRDGRWFDRYGAWHDRGDWGWRDGARWGGRGAWHGPVQYHGRGRW